MNDSVHPAGPNYSRAHTSITDPAIQTQVVTANGMEFTCLTAGEPSAPVVLLVHGFPDNATTFQDLLVRFADAGYRAVAPFTRGYAPSIAPPGSSFQLGALVQDVLAISRELSPSRQVTLVGHDWGALASVGAANAAPELFRSVTSLALPHPAVTSARHFSDWEQRKRLWYAFFFQLPDLPEAILNEDPEGFIRSLWTDWSPNWTPDPAHLERVVQTFRDPRTVSSAINYYRDTLDSRRGREQFRELQDVATMGRLTIPAQFLAGAADGCALASDVWLSNDHCDGPTSIEVFPDIGHFLHLEAADLVWESLIKFIEGSAP